MPARRPWDADEDDRYDRPPPRSSGGDTAVKVLLIVGGVLVCITLVCGGLGFYAFYSARKAVQQAQAARAQAAQAQAQAQMDAERQLANTDKARGQKAAEAFLKEMKQNRIDAAYQMTTAAYRQRVTPEALRALRAKHAASLESAGFLREDVFAPDFGDAYTYTTVLLDLENFFDLSVTLVKEADGWKVDQLTIERKRID